MKSPLDVLKLFAAHDGTLHGAFMSRLARDPDAFFLIQDHDSLTWGDFAVQVEQMLSVLLTQGVGHGDRIAMIGRNDLTHVLALFALARLGAIFVPVNPDFGARELAYVLAHADVQGVIAQTAVLPVVVDVMKEMPQSPWLLISDADEGLSDSLRGALDVAVRQDVVRAGIATDTCIIIYTSGTTGFPKGVMHSQHNLVRAGEANVSRLHLQPEDRILIILPFFHVNALFYSLSGTLAAGACMILVAKFSASVFWQVAADHGATVVNVIEAIGTILCARDRSEYRPDHVLRVVYGVRQFAAPVFRSEFGIHQLFSGFGMTEIPGVCCNPWDGQYKAGSMGTIGEHPDPAVRWAQCRIVDDTGYDVADNETGELWVRHPIVMQGYFRDPEQTAQAFEDGWLKTGDLVRRDDDGYYFHLSRKKDIIRRRGENIAAAELERVMGEHPAVYECAAVAVASSLGEDDILAAVVVRPGLSLREADITDWCRARLSAVKVPRYVVLMEGLPHTPTHKIAKAVLRADPTVLLRAVDFQAATIMTQHIASK